MKRNTVIAFSLIVAITGCISAFPYQDLPQNAQQLRFLVVWHSSTKLSFLIQKDYLSRLIARWKSYDIIIIPMSASCNKTLHITNADPKSLNDFENLRFKPANEDDNILQSKVVTGAISEHLDHNKTTKIAEEVLVLVDDASELDDVKASAAWKRKKISVVCVTKKAIPVIWQKLATDINHLLKLSGSDDDVPGEKKLIELFYNDSRLYCDTYQYLDDGRCTNCTYICSMKKAVSVLDQCREECPYFDRTPTDLSTDEVQKDEETMQADVETAISDNKWLMVVLTILSIVLVAGCICLLVCCWLRKRNQRHSDNEGAQIEIPLDHHVGFAIPATDVHEAGERGGSETTSFLSHADFPTGQEEPMNTDNSSSNGQIENQSVEFSQEPNEGSLPNLPLGIEFKDETELDANGHTFGEPFVKLHTGGQSDDATFVKGMSRDMVDMV